jgi:hypothetical protein
VAQFKLVKNQNHNLRTTLTLAAVTLVAAASAPIPAWAQPLPQQQAELSSTAQVQHNQLTEQQTLQSLQDYQQDANDYQMPQVERDGYWATPQSVLDKRAAEARAKKKAAIEKKRKAQAAKRAADAARAARQVAAGGTYSGPTAPASVSQAYARSQVLARGWGEGNFTCLVNLWNKESGWNVKASNGSSGAYGIPQALPGSKMATAGADWASNYKTQVNWGLGYIASSYGTPCNAWSHSQSLNWY